ncbi:MAG: hypothetical protein FJY09_05365 [Chlorobi bacterium]|nr:hypothetical protein [Chlorobiota bacterium]
MLYLQFRADEIGEDREQKLTGGGLIRLQGGWLHVVPMWKHIPGCTSSYGFSE